MTRPISAKSGQPCYGAAGDAVEIQQAGGMTAFKQGLHSAGYDEGFKAGYAMAYADAIQKLDQRVSKLENPQTSHHGRAGDQPRAH